MHNDTIFALGSAPGRAGVAVIRISGPDADLALGRLTRGKLPAPRLASVRHLYKDDAVIDQALVLRFIAPHSFTGENMVELHTHGGQAVVQATLAALAALPGYRLAEAGEFSRRAFDHGKLDLTKAEAIADLIDATTEAQRRQAIHQLDGSLSTLYHGWADKLIKALAHLEAYLDFPDEPLPPELEAAHEALIADLIQQIDLHLQQGQRGQRLRDGIRVAIIGAPNAGKSSLLNALTTRDSAIVSPIAGTTRDVIESAIDIGGYPVLLLDTAGLRTSDDPIEAEGIRRATIQAESADLLILIYDVSRPFPAELRPYLEASHLLLAANKVDLIEEVQLIDGLMPLPIIAKDGQIEPLLTALKDWLGHNYNVTEAPGLTRLRHQHHLQDALTHLKRSQQAPALDLVAEDLRLATRAIGHITGRVNVEDMLDIIFRDFCIGK